MNAIAVDRKVVALAQIAQEFADSRGISFDTALDIIERVSKESKLSSTKHKKSPDNDREQQAINHILNDGPVPDALPAVPLTVRRVHPSTLELRTKLLELSNKERRRFTIEEMSTRLGYTMSDVNNALRYMQSQNIVSVVGKKPLASGERGRQPLLWQFTAALQNTTH